MQMLQKQLYTPIKIISTDESSNVFQPFITCIFFPTVNIIVSPL